MRKTTTMILAAAIAIPLCFAAAAPAAAAPGDVTYSATTSGATITNTFTNNSDQPIGCEYAGVNEPYSPGTNYDGNYPYVFAGSIVVPAGQSVTLTADDHFVSQPLTVGQQVFVEWGCFTQSDELGVHEVWGTPLVESIDGIDEGEYLPTAPTTVIIVGVSVVPGPPPVDTCTGSACLPTGSFGF